MVQRAGIMAILTELIQWWSQGLVLWLFLLSWTLSHCPSPPVPPPTPPPPMFTHLSRWYRLSDDHKGWYCGYSYWAEPSPTDPPLLSPYPDSPVFTHLSRRYRLYDGAKGWHCGYSYWAEPSPTDTPLLSPYPKPLDFTHLSRRYRLWWCQGLVLCLVLLSWTIPNRQSPPVPLPRPPPVFTHLSRRYRHYDGAKGWYWGYSYWAEPSPTNTPLLSPYPDPSSV